MPNLPRALASSSKSTSQRTPSGHQNPLPLPTTLEATAAAAAKAVAEAAVAAEAAAGATRKDYSKAVDLSVKEKDTVQLPVSVTSTGSASSEDSFFVAMPHLVRKPPQLDLFTMQTRSALYFLSQVCQSNDRGDHCSTAVTGRPKGMFDSEPQLTLVLDLDETLVHCRLECLSSPRHGLRVNFEETTVQGYVYVRPFCQLFLEIVSRLFEVVVFTASSSNYADQVLNYLDPEGRTISRRMYRQHCTEMHGAYLKDVRTLGRPLSRIVLVDNSPVSTSLCVDNSIICKGWTADTTEDQELLDLLLVLQQCASHLCSSGSTVQSFLTARYGLGEFVQQLRQNPELLGLLS